MEVTIRKILALDEWKITGATILIFFLIAFSKNIVAAILFNSLLLFVYLYLANNDIYTLLPDKLKSEFNMASFKSTCITSVSILVLFPVIMFALGLITMASGFKPLTSLIIAFSPLLIVFVLNFLILDFSAQILTSYKNTNLTTFKDYFPTFLSYLIFPLGLLYTHKKVKDAVTIRGLREYNLKKRV